MLRRSLILLALAACSASTPAVGDDAPDAAGVAPDAAPGSDAAIAPDAAGAAPDAGPVLSLLSLSPASGGASVGTTVKLTGTLFPNTVADVAVGGRSCTQIVWRGASEIDARFPPVPLTEVGLKDVTVRFSDGRSLTLSQAFEYRFDEDSIVFVHGLAGSPANWDSMVGRFKALGYPASMLHAIRFADNFGSSTKNAAALASFVSDVLVKTSAAKVDVVSHSMGGFAFRLFVKAGGATQVRDYVSLGGPHHGSSTANLVIGDGASELRPIYACQGQSLNDLQFTLNGCLTSTGRTASEDETPAGVEDGGEIAYLSIYSDTDEAVQPVESACLNQRFRNDCADNLNVKVTNTGHLGLLSSQDVFDRSAAHLRRRNASR